MWNRSLKGKRLTCLLLPITREVIFPSLKTHLKENIKVILGWGGRLSVCVLTLFAELSPALEQSFSDLILYQAHLESLFLIQYV